MEDFLYKQAPIIVFMGIAIWILSKWYVDERKYSKELSSKAVDLAKESMSVVAQVNEIKSSVYKKIEELEETINKYHEKRG